MRVLALLACLALPCSILFGQPAQTGAAPAIVSTTPDALSNDVDPMLDKITVTFDQPMTDNSWSWTGGGETYPQTTGRPSYDAEKKTCTMPVKLEPGKAYWVGINSPSHRNFKSADGQPARRYVILFATKSADGKPTPLPPEMLTRARQINAASGKPAPAATSPAQQAAVEAAEAWMKLVDEEKYDEMFQSLDPVAMSMVAQDVFVAQVSTVREHMGKLHSRAFKSAEHHASLPGMPDGNYYILQFSASFENKKQGMETAVMREERGTWRVAGYFIR